MKFLIVLLLLFAPLARAAHCTGAGDCTACRNCSKCRHCAPAYRGKGAENFPRRSCGVCLRPIA